MILIECALLEKQFNKTTRTSNVTVFSCDQCGEVYTYKFSKRLIDAFKTGKRLFSFHSKDCYTKAMSKGGVACSTYTGMRDHDAIKKKREATCIERYGFAQAMKSEKVKEKAKQTVRERFGVDYPMQSAEVRQRSKETSLARYGVDHPTKSEEVKAAYRATCESLYGPGIINAFQATDVKVRSKQTSLARYGVEYPTQSDEIMAKVYATNMTRLGVKMPMQSADVRAKYDWHAIGLKRHETMKANETYGTSIAEQRCYELLCAEFGAENIEQQVLINGRWPIDFYVKTLGIYIQEDGVYWHGLDRPLETITSSGGLRDKQIYVKYCIDRRQEQWFANHDIPLVRITDKQVLSGRTWLERLKK